MRGETRFTKSSNEQGIVERLKNVEKCLRQDKYVIIGTDDENLFISSNAFKESGDGLIRAVYDSLFSPDTMQIFKGHVLHLHAMLVNHPAYVEGEEVSHE